MRDTGPPPRAGRSKPCARGLGSLSLLCAGSQASLDPHFSQTAMSAARHTSQTTSRNTLPPKTTGRAKDGVPNSQRLRQPAGAGREQRGVRTHAHRAGAQDRKQRVAQKLVTRHKLLEAEATSVAVPKGAASSIAPLSIINRGGRKTTCFPPISQIRSERALPAPFSSSSPSQRSELHGGETALRGHSSPVTPPTSREGPFFSGGRSSLSLNACEKGTEASTAATRLTLLRPNPHAYKKGQKN